MYIKEGDIKAGNVVMLDGGFTCHAEGLVTIEEDTNGLYFKCDHGQHYIDGQLDDGDEYIGITWPK